MPSFTLQHLSTTPENMSVSSDTAGKGETLRPPPQTLKPACVAALSRIFKLCDVNNDGLLDDNELNDFQRVCFSRPLQSHELAGIKEVIAAEEELGVVDGGLTEAGFLALHTHFIQKGRLETTWKALRTFGYGEDLTLREDFLHPRSAPPPLRAKPFSHNDCFPDSTFPAIVPQS